MYMHMYMYMYTFSWSSESAVYYQKTQLNLPAIVLNGILMQLSNNVQWQIITMYITYGTVFELRTFW